MQIEQRVSGDVTIVTINGDITLNKGGDVLLKDKIHSLLQQGSKKILLDLGGVSYVDSAGSASWSRSGPRRRTAAAR
jgi:anti-sigma B factor antagonist